MCFSSFVVRLEFNFMLIRDPKHYSILLQYQLKSNCYVTVSFLSNANFGKLRKCNTYTFIETIFRTVPKCILDNLKNDYVDISLSCKENLDC